ncbi:MAG: hypothetical protein GX089_11600 [Fibrobacter sp.]|jgi:hypothetical protein|nr:hypothetical protein [Fibrobacter sp.]
MTLQPSPFDKGAPRQFSIVSFDILPGLSSEETGDSSSMMPVSAGSPVICVMYDVIMSKAEK